METKKTNLFRKNDTLWHPSRGWGNVDCLHENREQIDISFKGCLRCVMGEDISLLSFTEYPVNANHTRPFEEGDVVYGAKKGWGVENIAIYRDEDSTYFHWDMSKDSIRHWGVPVGPDSILATEDQKQLLFDRLAQDNLRWNEKTRKLEDIQKPFKHGDILYYDNNKPHRFITIVGNDNREMLFMDIEKMKIHYFWESHISVGAVHANKVQKQLLFDELAKDGKIWNEETRQLEDMQRPEETEVEKLKRLWYNRNPYGDRFFETALCVFKDMNATAKQLEELNEPKVGDYCIFFDFQEYSAAMVGKLKAIYNNRVYNYRATQGCFENCIKWDGSKEHLDSVRNGIIK